MINTDEVIRRLNGLKGNYHQISMDTGIPFTYLVKLAADTFAGSGPSSYRIDILREHPLIKNYVRNENKAKKKALSKGR